MARDPARIDDVLQLLGRIWRQHPDQRLGQLLMNLCRTDDGWPNLWNVEDDRLIEEMLEFIRTGIWPC